MGFIQLYYQNLILSFPKMFKIDLFLAKQSMERQKLTNFFFKLTIQESWIHVNT